MNNSLCILTLLTTSLIASSGLSQAQQTYPFDWDNLFLAAAKMDKHFDYKANTDWYMMKYRPDVWRFAKNDEFTLNEKRAETEKLFREKVNKFDLESHIIVRSSLTLGEYDFENELFPIKGVDSGYRWLDRSYNSGQMPHEYYVSPQNIEILNRIPMSKDEARNFINSRKDRYGKVDRRIYVKFKMKLRDMPDRSTFNGEIQSGRFYYDRSYSRILGNEFKKEKLEQKTELAGVSVGEDSGNETPKSRETNDR